jgi:hypothetical protein
VACSGRTCHGDLCGAFSKRAFDVFRCSLSREDGVIALSNIAILQGKIQFEWDTYSAATVFAVILIDSAASATSW